MRSVVLRLLLGVALFPLAKAAAAADEPRPLTPAERGAVELALAYAERGPEAIWERLADDAPLRALGREAALAELTARLGARDGTTWRLQTPAAALGPAAAIFSIEFASGVDDLLRLELVDRQGPRVRGLWTLLDRPPAVSPLLPGLAAVAPRSGAAARGRELGGGVALGLALLTAATLLPERRWRWSLAAAGCGLAVALAACSRDAARTAAAESEPAAPPLAALAPLRLSLTGGGDRAAIERELAAAERALGAEPSLRDGAPPAAGESPAGVAPRRVIELWRAQLLLVEGDPNGAEALLGGAAAAADPPLAQQVRARAAAARLRGDTALAAYDEVARAGFDHDGLALERYAVAAFTQVETDARALPLLASGTRLAEAWYEAASEALIDGQDDLAESTLRTAWRSRPLPRDEVFAEPALAALAARPEIFPLFELGAAAEPSVDPGAGREPLPLPAGASGRLCGDHYTVERGGFTLEVPGGVRLAPVATPIEDAAARRQREEASALAALAVPGDPAGGAAASPRRLRLAQTAARALAREGDWPRLLELTTPFAAAAPLPAPDQLVRLRALALHRLDRGAEAKSALAGLAQRALGARRPAPGTLYDLAELLAADGDYETAIRLVKKADAQLAQPRGERRLRQLELSRDLASDAREQRSRHFLVRYPAATGDRYGEQILAVLEQERSRLLAWIPEPGGKRIGVDLFPLRQFLSAYGGNVEVAGIFDGRLRMPLADLRSLDPRLIAIVTHELAHALLDAATAGRAPRWFQEGLAQHVEMGTVLVNPLPELEASGRALALPALEPILDGFAEPQLVELAYAEAAWAVAYVEQRFGVAGIRGLVRSFAGGATTAEAIERLAGSDLATFDRAFRDWAAERAPASRRLEARRFDRELDRPFDPESEAARAERRATRDLALPGPSALRPAADGEAMRSWHLRYREATAAVRRAYAPVTRAFASGGGAPTAADCAELRRVASELLTARAADLGAPDLGVANELRRVYEQIAALGRSCEAGRAIEAAALYESVGASLGRAAQKLAPYGLQP